MKGLIVVLINCYKVQALNYGEQQFFFIESYATSVKILKTNVMDISLDLHIHHWLIRVICDFVEI